MSHYFLNDESLQNVEKKYDVQIKSTSFRFYTNSGVFSKEGLDFGTRTLLESIELPNHVESMIDMGCGYGPIGIYFSKTHPKLNVFMYDVNERAIDLVRKNAIENQVEIQAKASYLFKQVEHRVDAIITNPPIRAGKKVVFQLYEDAYQHLNENGVFYCVIQRKQGAPSSYKQLKHLFGNCSIINKKAGYWVLLSHKKTEKN